MNTQRKKILYVITKGTWGGAQRYLFDLATALPKSEYNGGVALGGDGLLRKRLAAEGVETIPLPTLQRDISFVKEIYSFFSLYNIFRNIRPDIVHLNSSKAAGLGALAARLADVPRIIFTAHGWPFKEDRPWFIQLVIYAATWLTVFLSHGTIVVSKQDEALGKKMRLVSTKITYIPLALKAADDILERPVAEKKLSFGMSGNTAYKTPCRLVTIAELTKNKGVLPYGVEMIRKLEQDSPGAYSYTIFGKGENLPELQNQSGKLPICFENIAEYSEKPSDLSTDASRYLKAFDIFVLPSIKEGMPYVLLEAAAAGLPIVATSVVQEEADILPNMRLVRPKDGYALARAVQHLKENMPAKTERAAFQSFPRMLKQTVALYRV